VIKEWRNVKVKGHVEAVLEECREWYLWILNL
jgi:hypothetical protein